MPRLAGCRRVHSACHSPRSHTPRPDRVCTNHAERPGRGADRRGKRRYEHSDATPSISVSADTPSPAAAKVPATLRFTSTTVDGKRFEGSSLAGKPVLLWFWAPWCPTCRGQVAQVQKIASDHRGDVSVLGVGSLDDADAIRAFARGFTDVTHLADESGVVWKHFGVTQQSSFVLLDASGAKVFSAGYGGSDELDERVAAVVR
jgi:thiol-disulfide isomerase/thioredoxin